MKYNQFGRTGLFVSEICLGAMTFGGNEDAGFWKAIGQLGQAEVDGLVSRALACGVNFFDTADVYSYGQSERLLGQASNGDVVTVNLAKDYKAVSATEEDTQDGEKQLRHCYKVAMQAGTPDATYHHIEMWIEVGSYHPVKARFYADSNKLLKSAYYRRYEKQLGLDRPTETVIIDGLDPKWVTVMRYSDLVKRDVPDLWLQREYLPRFKPQ